METVVFITGNDYKYQVAREALKNTSIDLVQRALETPEIQSTSVEAVASSSAIWASHHLNQPVIVTDVGFYIKALNGFPGPFIKWVNQWFTATDYLNLLKNKTDRTIEVIEALAFCRPDSSPTVFVDTISANLSTVAGRPGYSPINQLYIPFADGRVESEIPRPEMVKYWAENSTKWQQFADFYQASVLKSS